MFARIYQSSLQTYVGIQLKVPFKGEETGLKFWGDTNTDKGKDKKYGNAYENDSAYENLQCKKKRRDDEIW